MPLTREQFRERFFARFYDPAFDEVQPELEKIFERAWDGYIQYRKSPRTQPAGRGVRGSRLRAARSNGLPTRIARSSEAEKRHRDPASPSRILIVSGATRSEHTCPGEVSKTLAPRRPRAQTIEAQAGFEVDLLEMSQPRRRAVEGDPPVQGLRLDLDGAVPLAVQLLPEPRHGPDQRLDEPSSTRAGWRRTACSWLCPVHWYQAPASLKLMMDRLVCADGGNPDPTTTHGKDPDTAKALELAAGPTRAISPGAPSPWSRTAIRRDTNGCAKRWWNG